jgi:aspartate/methionine/tyrosine aminotransferase
VQSKGGITLLDEIYLGLSYEATFGHTALALDDQVVSINSFSKYFNMTGWRLGWLVVPEELVAPLERLAQNLFICPSTVAQHAALACFAPESIAEYERRRAEFKARRDWFIPQLQAMGLTVPVMPDGAFYAWADCSAAAQRLGVQGSWDFAFEAMKRAHVAVTPGRDFGTAETSRFIRFSTANSMAQLQEAAARLKGLLG